MSESILALFIAATPISLDINRSGWNAPPPVQAALHAYRVTGDVAWLEAAKGHIDVIVNSTDKALGVVDVLGNSLDQWSTSGYSVNGELFPNEVSFGTFGAVIAEYLLVSLKRGDDINQDHIELIAAAAEGSIALLKNLGVDKARAQWDVRYNPYRKSQYSSEWLPLNMQSHIALGLLMTYRVLEYIGDSRYLRVRDKYHKMALYISSKISRANSQLTWNYYNDDRIDDWGHAGATVRFIAYDYIYGTAFSLGDMTKLKNILKHTGGEYLHPFRIDGTPFTESNERYYERYFSAYFYWVIALKLIGAHNDNVVTGMHHLANQNPLIHYQVLSELL